MSIGTSWESDTWVEDSWVNGSWGADETVAEFTQVLHAGATDTLLHAETGVVQVLHAQHTDALLHAEAAVGGKNEIYILATLTDESGEVLVDQTGEVLIAYGQIPVQVIHAAYTDTLIHAEDLS